MADNTQLKFIKNNTEVNNITICDTTTCLPLNITGSTVYFRMKCNISDSDADAVYTTCVVPSGHTCGECGQTRIVIPAATTATWESRFYYWQINIVDASLNNNLSYINNVEVTDTLYHV